MENEEEVEEEEEETNIEETTSASTTGLAKVQQIRDNFAATIDAKLASPPPQMTHSKVPSMTIPNIALTTEDTRESAELIDMDSDNPITEEQDTQQHMDTKEEEEEMEPIIESRP